jgi:hypothetical protein
MIFSYRFVPQGARAPDPVENNELWLDVGKRAAPQVLDHHGGDTQAQSAFQLILEKYRPFIVTPLSGMDRITCVLHTSPDLDAVASAWLAQKILNGSAEMLNHPALNLIGKAVTDNDQGMVRTTSPGNSWPIVMRALLMTASPEKKDFERLTAGLDAIEKTWQMLTNGCRPDSVCRKIMTSAMETILDKAATLYENDISSADIFQINLPVSQYPPLKQKADAIILHNPQSVLFKELARGDEIHSPQKKGFDLLIVSKSFLLSQDQVLHRYIISTDPLTGFYLKGLGAKLDMLEQEKKEKNGLTLKDPELSIKFRSAWYDGRGHHYTIVDSPSVEINGRSYCLSCLSIDDIRSAVETLVSG